MTGGMLPSLVRCNIGSTPSVPSWRAQNVHMGTSWCSLPSLPLIVIPGGNSSISHTCFTQGPTPTTTKSHLIFPLSVTTVVTAPLLSLRNPITLTPAMILTPFACALLARPCIDTLLLAYPPFFSCSTEVTPFACQSAKRPFMYVNESLSPSINTD